MSLLRFLNALLTCYPISPLHSANSMRRTSARECLLPSSQACSDWKAFLDAASRSTSTASTAMLMKQAASFLPDAQGHTILMFASEQGHVGAVKLLLSARAPINAANIEGWTAVMFAARNGHEDVLSELLSARTVVSSDNNMDSSAAKPLPPPHALLTHTLTRRVIDQALVEAAGQGKTAVVRVLARMGADVNARSNDTTPLIAAAIAGHVDVLRALVAHRPKLELRAQGMLEDGHIARRGTALLFAVLWRHVAAMEVLLAAGANVNTTDKFGRTPLFIAAQERWIEGLHVLLRAGASVDAKYDGRTALAAAAVRGDFDMVQLLLAARADVHTLDNCGVSPLIGAAAQGHAQVVEALVRAGAQLEHRAVRVRHGKFISRHATALQHAVASGHVDAAKVLIDARADVNTVDEWNTTPLMLAAVQSMPRMLPLLIDANADVNASNNSDFTALGLAAKKGLVDMVKILISSPAGPPVQTGQTEPAIVTAAKYAQAAVVRVLLDARVDVDAHTEHGETACMHAVLRGSAPLTEMLLAGGAAREKLGCLGATMFYVANSRRCEAVLRVLLAANANVDGRNEDGETALMYSAQIRDRQTVLRLLSWGADIEARDNRALTPLLHATSARANVDVTRALLTAGARVDVCSARGVTPLMMAARWGDSSVAEIMGAYAAQLLREL